MEISEQIRKYAELFEKYVEPHLTRELGGELLSIEAAAEAPLATVLDRGSSSDLILSYLSQGGCLYTVANRIRIIKDDLDGKPLDFTFRNSYPGSSNAPCFDAELTKLIRAREAIREEHKPALLPLYFVFSRLRELENGSHKLVEVAYVETLKILDVIIDKDKFNLMSLRQRQAKYPKKAQYIDNHDKSLGGIQYVEQDGNSFAYLSLEYLKQFELGIVHRRIL